MSEEKAREQGWVPLDEWRGEPDKWVDADKFIERGETILPILQSRLDKAEAALETNKAELDKMRTEVAEGRATSEEFKKFHDDVMANQKQRYERAITELKQDKADALSEGDGKKVVEIEGQIEEIEDAAAKAEPTRKADSEPDGSGGGADDIPPEIKEWIAENEWFAKDEVLRAFADGYALQIRDQYEGRAMLDKLAEKTKETFPGKFQNPNRNRDPDVDNGGGKPPTGGNGYDDLPPEARQACDRFIKQFPGYTREQYCEEYFGEEA